MKNKCKSLILCGGKGTRLGELGMTLPKALLEIDGKSILYRKFEHSIKQGFSDFIVAVGYKGDLIIKACNELDLNCHIQFSDSGEDAGMLQRIYDAKELYEDRVIITYGDSFSSIQLETLIEYHEEKNSLVTIVVSPIQSPFALVNIDNDSKALSFEEKPILKYYIGTFILGKRAFDLVPQKIISWPDGTGLIAFFKILIALNNLNVYIYEGLDITFNTVDELNAANQGFLKFYTHFK